MPDVWIIDSASLIQLKIDVPGSEQWELFKRLEAMVESGEIAFPRQVSREVTEYAHPDVPGVWVRAVEPKLRHPKDPHYGAVQNVMAVAGNVIDQLATGSPADPADPYVLALALELKEAGLKVAVISDDVLDKPALGKISVRTACQRLGLDHDTAADFLRQIGWPPVRAGAPGRP